MLIVVTTMSISRSDFVRVRIRMERKIPMYTKAPHTLPTLSLHSPHETKSVKLKCETKSVKLKV